MSRNQIIRIAMVVCAVVVALAVILAVSGVFGSTGYTYAEAAKYTAGETDVMEQVRNLEIDWTSGRVRIEYGSQQAILLREKASWNIGEEMKLRWWLDGDTLRIRYAASGWKQLFNWGNKQKDLTVTLPEGLVLNTVSVDTVSADQEMPRLKAGEVKLNSVSGDIRCTAESGNMQVTTVSGEAKLELAAAVKRLEVSSVSGNINLQAGDMEEVVLSSTSGDIRLKSGRIDSLRISTTSGDALLTLPADYGFTAKVSTVSGKMDSTMALSKDGNTYTCGDGSGKLELSTVSGDIRMEAAGS